MRGEQNEVEEVAGDGVGGGRWEVGGERWEDISRKLEV